MPNKAATKKDELLKRADDLVQSGAVRSALKDSFGRQMGSILFELIRVGQNHEDEFDLEWIEELPVSGDAGVVASSGDKACFYPSVTI